MVCECGLIWIKTISIYNDACILSAWKNSDCTIVDVGCGIAPYLHEIKRHLLQHGINCKTIGIDKDESNVEVDSFIKKDICDVKGMTSTADIVLCKNVLTMMHSELLLFLNKTFLSKAKFKEFIMSCVDMIKDDGVIIMNLTNRRTWKIKLKLADDKPGVKIMNKNDAIKHAESCYMKYFEECEHGLVITDNTTQDDIREYLTWLPVWNGKNNLKRDTFG